jgi:outer membrane receptor protein involved in Fe transport
MLAVLGCSGTAWAQTRTFDIPAEDAVKAIPEFARQAGIQIVAPADRLKGVHTPAITGSMDLHAALDKLLAGTGIEIVSDDGQTIILRGRQKNAEAAPSAGAAPIETVTVTGSHLPGTEPVSPVITLDRTTIQNSGYANTAELMRTLPQNFGGGIQPTTLGTLGESTNNVSSASTVNLRGLGAESTLTLIDGHRLASDGFVGGAVDVSAIPLAAVDHIEVLTDGASATYGADAVGGVVNFVLRQDYDGAQSSGQIGTSTQGGGTQYEGSQLVGKDWGSGGGLLNYEYSRQDFLFGGHRSFSAATPEPFTLVPEEDRSSVFGTVHQDLTPDVSVFAEGLYTFRTGEDQETIPGYFSYVNRYRSQIYGFDFGANWQIDQDWHANITGTISHDRVNSSTYENVGGPYLGGENFDNGMYAVEALVNGTIEGLPTGDVSVAIGGGYRAEQFYNSGSAHGFDRNVAYVFGEMRVPLVMPSDDRIGLEKLELSVDGRFEHYSDFGSTTNPKLGLLYVPIHGVSLRSTWGTSFRAPGLYIEDGQRQIVAYPSVYYAGVPAGDQVLLVAGANRNLKPEKSETWTMGTDINPDFLPDFKLSFTAFGIGYRDRIITPLANRGLAFVTPADAPFVQLAPTPAQQAAVIANGDVFDDYTGGSGPYDPSKVYGIAYDQYQNVSSENASGFDLTGNYHLDSDVGGFDLFGNGSWLRFAEHATKTAPAQILSGTIFNPPVFKARAGATWTEDDWSVSAILNHISPETDSSSGSAVHVPAWTTADLQVSYSTTDWNGYLHGIRLGLSVHNLFDTDPPALSSTGFQAPYFSSGYDSANASPFGRFISLSISKDW